MWTCKQTVGISIQCLAAGLSGIEDPVELEVLLGQTPARVVGEVRHLALLDMLSICSDKVDGAVDLCWGCLQDMKMGDRRWEMEEEEGGWGCWVNKEK
jgi:hypothetical protein